tara:strand:+ start:97 stop:330 length:234 start_codon:yes stop_codon:yes gene_type:complete
MEMDALINVGLTAAVGGLGWWLKSQHDELGRVRILLNRTREELAKEYVSKVENNTVMDRVMDRFDRLEEKIDRLMER